MTAELGLFLLIIALMVSLLQASYLLPDGRLRALLTPCMRPAAWLQALSITLAFAVLVTLRLDSDFTVANVIAHSNRALPTLYKITGSWGNHEGSMLLWVWVLATFGALVALPRTMEDGSLKHHTVAVQSALCAGFLLFIVFTSNPFERRFPPTVDGEALNPLLQDIALAIHPPLLYLGYVGFSIVFSLAVAALLSGRMERDWADVSHPWILGAWSALTLGIGLGSWWAYRELGWGGWWFWDPVENASLMPWLAGTALLHSNLVLRKRGFLQSWVLLLAIVTFGLSLLGTFLVRSGVLTSVHSFASDPMRGSFILVYIVTAIGGALLLYALRVGRLVQPETSPMLPLSREGMIVINNLFLLTACATVLLGTLYPMLAEALAGERLTVGPPYFNLTFLPLVTVPLVFAGLAPFMPWRKARTTLLLRSLTPALIALLAALLLIMAFVQRQILLATLGLGVAAWLGATSIRWLIKTGLGRISLPVFFGHFGAAILVAGVTSVGLWKEEAERWMLPGESIAIAGYELTYEGNSVIETENHYAQRAEFTVRDAGGRIITSLYPEYRTYAIRKSTTSEAAIRSTLSDLYLVIGESAAESKRTAVRVYYNPMIIFIWSGFVLMALGGLIAIMQKARRVRITF